uniref:Rap-GAP domain-containing protein n=1 Tax=Arcella intermedia TaxID=1963864 RepID=A0A6B2L821_9EUKA
MLHLLKGDPEEWHIEYGDGGNDQEMDIMFRADDVPFYGSQLYDIEHNNYIGISEENPEASVPVVLSIEKKTKHKTQDKLKCIIRTGEATRRVWIPSDVPIPKGIQKICPDLSNITWQKVKSPDLCKDLIIMEERGIYDNYKFGVLYSNHAKSENDLYSVLESEASDDYKKFLGILGDRIVLEGWQGFRGGLDVKSNTTGTHSIFTKLQKYSVMFHVCTLLPSQEADLQRIERKRHIGNDVVVIIYHEGDTPFDLSIITSQFIRIVILIKKVESSKELKYHMIVASRREVAVHTPLLPTPPIFEANSHFKHFLLTKCINAERTALKAEDIRLKMARTNTQLLLHLVHKYRKKVIL